MNWSSSCLAAALLPSLALLTSSLAEAQQSYPRVYGPSGALYGPTQAHYQYERRYGRPWHGTGGIQVQHRHGHGHHHHGHHHHHHGGWGYGGYWGGPLVPPYGLGFSYSGYGFYGSFGYGPGVGGGVGVPYLAQPYPEYYGRNPFDNDVLQGTLEENALQWGQPEPLPAKPTVKAPVRKTSPETKVRSLHLQGFGDVLFRRQNFPQAYQRYREAAATAPDLATPHFRLGITLAAMHRYEAAVAELKRGLSLDPTWPLTGESLADLFGEDNIIARNSMLHEVAEWVRADIRDPDRLFLFGVLLHFNGDAAQARSVLETAARLGGSPEHVMVFLNPVAPERANPGEPAPAKLPAAVPQPAPFAPAPEPFTGRRNPPQVPGAQPIPRRGAPAPESDEFPLPRPAPAEDKSEKSTDEKDQGNIKEDKRDETGEPAKGPALFDPTAMTNRETTQQQAQGSGTTP